MQIEEHNEDKTLEDKVEEEVNVVRVSGFSWVLSTFWSKELQEVIS